ncbi:MFS transporter [Halosimplex rubrum]|uniref:MFS transporter n=1 Tax=Halosimplex rubrum TaxID=869889 RepID=A0A7D5TCA1_9EURY|nr:MFS transporter [Halosimplex rubrum]QLH77136.1 MFS transporter [Halosimplex rubrum]
MSDSEIGTATATEPSTARQQAIDSARSWLLVALGVCMLTTIWGVIFTFTVYAGRLSTAFDLTGLQASSVFSITTAVFLVSGGVFGVVAARFPLRPVVAAAGVGLAVAAAGLGAVDSYVGVIAAFALLGTAGGTAFIVVVSLVPQWFDAHEGTAMGITMAGNGLGVLIVPFAWLWLFDRVDFPTAFAAVAGAAAVVVILSSLVFRRPPGHSETTSTVGVDWLRRRLADRSFVGAALGYGLLWGWYYVLSSQLVDILTGNGVDAAVAAGAFGIVGGVSIVARVGGGFVGDRLGARNVFAACVALTAACVLVLPAVGSRPALYAVLVGFGIGNGTLAALWSPIVLTRFGSENATATVGLLNTSTAGAAFLSPLAISALRGVTGGYTVPLVALALVTAVGVALFHWGTAPASERGVLERAFRIASD